MALQTAVMATPDRAAEARVDPIDSCPSVDEAGVADASLFGWRAGAAGALVGLVLVLISIPIAAAVDPALLAQASRLLVGLAGLTPLTLAARAVVFVVALAVITRPDGSA